jgi:plasmid stabilization system protein ParE
VRQGKIVSDVVWSLAALDDLDSILRYIAAENPIAAYKVIDRIEVTGLRLGRMISGRPGRVPGTYEKSVIGLPYIIAYTPHRPARGKERVVILRVIHSARNWPKGIWPKD